MNRLHHWYCQSAHWRSTLEKLLPWALAGVSIGDHLLELGPGPGLVTPMLAARTPRLTAIDNDPVAVAALRHTEGRVGIVRGDAARLPFAAGTFSAVAAFTMLHHIPTAGLQEQLFREVFRTLRPGGVFVAVDAPFSLALRLFHLGDTFTPLSRNTVGPRLSAAGFTDIAIDARSGYLRLRARVSP
jgi:SAM-dependent methyltransferase